MPIIDFTQPFFLFTALALFLLCLYLARNNRSNTVTCVMLLCFVTLLVGHTIELANAPTQYVQTLAICILVDEIFTFISFLSFLWVDRIEIEYKKSKKSKKSGQKGKKDRIEDKVIEDGLDILWKKV